MPTWIFWLCLITLCGSGLASDVPFVFDEDTSDLASYSSDQLQEASSSSPDLVGVPPVISPSDSEVLEIPVTGGGSTPEGKLEKEVGDLKDELNRKVEPDYTRIREDAAMLASKHPGDLGINQICEIYYYLKFGNDTKSGWKYVRDTRGIDSWNYANASMKIGDRSKCVGLGDCDDFAILMAAFVESIGGATRIILVNNNSTGGHAYAEVYLGRINDPNHQVEAIMEWLQQEFDTGKIYGHVGTDTKEVWLNLDWGPDEKGNTHPGGPLFQGDRHDVLRIREKYKLIPLREPETPNKSPKLISLTPDKNSPQEAGSVVTWTARAIDPEKDHILYQFFLNNDPISKWQKDNTWNWITTDYDIDENQIGVWVRDGKHAGPNAFDSNKVASFSITEPKPKPTVLENQPPVIISMESDKSSPQGTGTLVTWTAEASDPESDSLVYRFLLRGTTVSDWSSASSWTWTTTSDDIGENQIEVQVRDGKHAGSEEFDDQRSVSFTISARGTTQPEIRPQVETMPHSEKISGTGSIKKDYYIQNKANDYAKVSVDIKNAAYYEFRYSINSDEIQCNADLDLVVKQAESLTCSGNAKNRKNIPADITTSIKNGDLEYNNSVVASNQGVQASQNISFDISGNSMNDAIDSIDAIGTASGDNNIILENIIAANTCENFQGMQKISVGRDTSTYTQIDAITGPLKVSSSIWDGDRKLNTIANVAMGVVSIHQLINPSDARQYSQSIIGGATFDTMVTNADRVMTRVNTMIGSGNLNLYQLASWKDALYNVEYEYLPTSYQTGTYDENLNTSRVERDYGQSVPVSGPTQTTSTSTQYQTYGASYPIPAIPAELVAGDTPVTIQSQEMRGYQVYLDEVLIGTEGTGGDALDGKFGFSVVGNQNHNINVYDGQFNYPKDMYFAKGVSKIINVEPETAVYAQTSTTNTAPTPHTPDSAESLGLHAPSDVATFQQIPTTKERAQTLISTSQDAAYATEPAGTATNDPVYESKIVPTGGYTPNSLYISYAPLTIASCNLYANLALWIKTSGKGYIWFYEWYPSGMLDTQYAGSGDSPGWYKRWFFADTPGWHILQYYCNGWSNYGYVYVYDSESRTTQLTGSSATLQLAENHTSLYR